MSDRHSIGDVATGAIARVTHWNYTATGATPRRFTVSCSACDTPVFLGSYMAVESATEAVEAHNHSHHRPTTVAPAIVRFVSRSAPRATYASPHVIAQQLDQKNAAEIAAWTCGRVAGHSVVVADDLPTVEVGMWVVAEPGGYWRVLDHEAFTAIYRHVPDPHTAAAAQQVRELVVG